MLFAIFLVGNCYISSCEMRQLSALEKRWRISIDYYFLNALVSALSWTLKCEIQTLEWPEERKSDRCQTGKKKETQEALELRKGESTFHATFISTDKKIWNEKFGLAKKTNSEQLPPEDTEGQVAMDGFPNDTYLTSRILLLNWSSLTVAFPGWRVPIPLGPLVLVQKKKRKKEKVHSF